MGGKCSKFLKGKIVRFEGKAVELLLILLIEADRGIGGTERQWIRGVRDRGGEAFQRGTRSKTDHDEHKIDETWNNEPPVDPSKCRLNTFTCIQLSRHSLFRHIPLSKGIHPVLLSSRREPGLKISDLISGLWRTQPMHWRHVA